MNAGGGEGSAHLLASILEPTMGPFLRQYLRSALQKQLMRGRQSAPNMSPMEYLGRGYLPASPA